MKKTIICVLAVCLSLTAVACGNMRIDTPVVSPVPYVDTNIDDGIVNDNDGIITDNESTAHDYNVNNGRVSRGTIDIENKNDNYNK